MTAARRDGSHEAGSVSAKRRGWYGGCSAHPAIAGAPTAPRRVAPLYQASSSATGSPATWGTRSPHFDDTRDVHRSGGSTTWVSVSMIGMPLTSVAVAIVSSW